MNIDWGLAANVTIPFLTLVAGAVLDRILERRPKLLTYYGHVSSFMLNGESSPIPLNMHSVVLWNAGRKSATNVKMGHSYLPEFRLNPSVEYTVESLPGGGEQITIPRLVPGEQVTVSYLYFPPIVWTMVNSFVKSDEGMAQVIKVLPARQYPKWVLRLSRLLLLIGAVTVAYLIVAAARAVL